MKLWKWFNLIVKKWNQFGKTWMVIQWRDLIFSRPSVFAVFVRKCWLVLWIFEFSEPKKDSFFNISNRERYSFGNVAINIQFVQRVAGFFLCLSQSRLKVTFTGIGFTYGIQFTLLYYVLSMHAIGDNYIYKWNFVLSQRNCWRDNNKNNLLVVTSRLVSSWISTSKIKYHCSTDGILKNQMIVFPFYRFVLAAI